MDVRGGAQGSREQGDARGGAGGGHRQVEPDQRRVQGKAEEEDREKIVRQNTHQSKNINFMIVFCIC